jgi:hypothetical protein
MSAGAARSRLEQIPQKLADFREKNSLRHFESCTNSFRSNDSAQETRKSRQAIFGQSMAHSAA